MANDELLEFSQWGNKLPFHFIKLHIITAFHYSVQVVLRIDRAKIITRVSPVALPGIFDLKFRIHGDTVSDGARGCDSW